MSRLRRTGQVPGVVTVRLSGDTPTCDVLASILRDCPAIKVITQYGPYPNRRAPSERMYLTVRLVTGGNGTRSRP